MESYQSKQGYLVNILRATTIEEKDRNMGYKSKCYAIFVADGIRYTLSGSIELEKMKELVDSMQLFEGSLKLPFSRSLFILFRRDPNLLAETGAEGGGIPKTTGISGFRYRIFLALQQLPGFSDAKLQEVLFRGNTGGFHENFIQIRPVDSHIICNILHFQIIRIVIGDIIKSKLIVAFFLRTGGSCFAGRHLGKEQ